jgi:large subunit ribosomal protein L25
VCFVSWEERVDKIKLTARVRELAGKSYTRKARKGGWIPAAYYGFGMEPVKIEVNAHEFELIVSRKQHNKLIELSGDGIAADAVAVIREKQRDAVADKVFYHIDFQKVDDKKSVKARCFLKLVGGGDAIKAGAILNQAMYEVDVEGTVNSIPEVVELDISNLNAGDSAVAGDVKLPKDVRLLTSSARVVARLLGKTAK